MNRRIALIATGAANLFNIELALRRLGATVARVHDASELKAFDAIVFPGVAHFGFLAETLRCKGLDVALRDAIAAGYPFAGICAGMQILYEASDEAPGIAGLGVLPGTVRRLRGPKNPHMGWNRVDWQDRSQANDGWAYFANSYGVEANAASVVATTDYGMPFGSVCVRDNIVGMQFHPERSGRYGRDLLERLVMLRTPLYVG